MKKVTINLNPSDLNTIRNLLQYERQRYDAYDLNPPLWVNKYIPEFNKEMEDQDSKHSSEGNMDEAPYLFTPKQSEALAYLMFMWFKHMHESRRRNIGFGFDQIIQEVFAVAEKFQVAHNDAYESYWEERYK